MNQFTIIPKFFVLLFTVLTLVSLSCGKRGNISSDDHGSHEGHDDHEKKAVAKDDHGDQEGHDDHEKKAGAEDDHGDHEGHDDHEKKAGAKDDHSDHEGHDDHEKKAGAKDDHSDHEGHDDHEGHAEEKTGAEFSKESGILIHEEAAEVIQLKTAKASKEKLALDLTTTARVYQVDHKHPHDETEKELLETHALATAIITPAQADMLKEGDPVVLKHPGVHEETEKGLLVRLDRTTTQATGQVEALIAIPKSDHFETFGSFLQVTFTGKPIETIAIPKKALLNAATGNFVYVQHDGRYLRTPVEVGMIGSEHIGILKGIKPDDIVVSNGTVGLWLIELRFTKGGGHSH